MGRRARRAFTKEYKAEVVRLVKTSGKSVGQVAKQLDLTETAVRAWVKQAAIDEKRDPLGPLRHQICFAVAECARQAAGARGEGLRGLAGRPRRQHHRGHLDQCLDRDG